MTNQVHGNIDVVEGVVALRAVQPGHLHEIPDGRVGYYGGAQNVAIGELMTLEARVALKLDADAFAAENAGDPALYDFTDQRLELTGTQVGLYVEAKALNATKALVGLNLA